MLKLLGVLVGLAGIAAAIFFLFAGGIEQIVSGATANPVSTGDIVWGAVKVFCTSLGIWGAVILGGLVAALSEV